MLAGEAGRARQWAIEHQMRVGRYLGAADFVPVSQAHIMADTESLGVAGVEWLERLAALPEQRTSRSHPHHHRSARHRLRRGGAAEAAGLDAGAGAPRHRRVRGTRRADDRHLHQLPDHHAGGARRAHGVWRHRRGDLLEQRIGRAVEFRGRAVGARRRPDRPHAALWLSSAGTATRHAAAAHRTHAARTARVGCAGWHRRPDRRRLLAGAGAARHRPRSHVRRAEALRCGAGELWLGRAVPHGRRHAGGGARGRSRRWR